MRLETLKCSFLGDGDHVKEAKHTAQSLCLDECGSEARQSPHCRLLTLRISQLMGEWPRESAAIIFSHHQPLSAYIKKHQSAHGPNTIHMKNNLN